MNLTPLADRVIVAPDPVVSETKSGLALVEDWPQETSGTVASVGASVRDVKVGDRVVFGQDCGQVMHINEERFFVMRERDVIAVIEGAA